MSLFLNVSYKQINVVQLKSCIGRYTNDTQIYVIPEHICLNRMKYVSLADQNWQGDYISIRTDSSDLEILEAKLFPN
jgi:hypothetical protein